MKDHKHFYQLKNYLMAQWIALKAYSFLKKIIFIESRIDGDEKI